MKSPFPGMDPYIEACGLWADFHDDLIQEIKRALAQSVPERYLVRTGERSYVVLADTEGKEAHPFVPDVSMTTPPAREPPKGGTAAVETATETESLSLRAFIAEQYRETFLEIYEADSDRRLVTCIEVLSPSNKRRGSEGWELYLRKRQGLLLGAAHLVEIDLLRAGQRLPMLDPWPNSSYTLLLCRRQRAPHCRVWPAHFQRPLPIIPVPLAEPDPDVSLNLQPMIEAIYARSRYHRDINYSRPLTPALAAAEAARFEQQLRTRQTPS
jgi:hypothetical protein